MKPAISDYLPRAEQTASYLVDEQGQILGFDSAGRLGDGGRPEGFRHLRELLGDAASEALAEIARGKDDFVTPFRVPVAGEDQKQIGHVHVRRFVGGGGVFAVVTLHRDEPALGRDALTGLADRRAIATRLAFWQAAGEGRVRCAVLFVDLNDFKQVNDVHGHAVGDQAIVEVSQRLAHCVREGDLVVRHGGDEFVVLLREIGNRRDAQPVIERICGCVNEPIQIGSHSLLVSAAVGLALFNGSNKTIDEAIAEADRDMYAHKRRLPR